MKVTRPKHSWSGSVVSAAVAVLLFGPLVVNAVLVLAPWMGRVLYAVASPCLDRVAWLIANVDGAGTFLLGFSVVFFLLVSLFVKALEAGLGLSAGRRED